MPLFGSSQQTDETRGLTDSNAVGGGRHHVHPTGQLPGAGTGNVNTFGQTQPGSGHGANYNNDNTFASQHGALNPFGHDDQHTAGGGGHLGGGHGIAPAGAVDNHGTSQTSSHGSAGGGAGARITGKIESTIGSIVGSDALKAKGLQKENEANQAKLQGREIGEAERLEREALLRRERAVAHGAAPGNSGLGAGNPGVGSGQGHF